MHRKPRFDLTEQKFGRLIVKGCAGQTTGSGTTLWRCVCVCGTEKIVSTSHLRRGETSSCGCFRREMKATRDANTKHGRTNTSEYAIWRGIKARCFNDKCKAYKWYGARGISMSASWINSFENFIKDVGDRPSTKHSLDRLDNDGNYEPGNVAWRTKREQSNNKSNTVFLEFGGKVLPLAFWVEETGLKRTTIKERLRRGWSISDALETRPRCKSV